jgi:hypothetical protein
LYLAADGARATRPGEARLCEQARRVVATIDWPCDVKTLFRERNLGCKQAVSQAIDWFFDQEEEGIILEDDCVPDQSFFRFCDELLEHYRHNDRVALISGDNFQFGRRYGDSSYYFSRYVHIWGWASWRRTWRYYDRNASAWPEFGKRRGLEQVLGSRRREIRYWRRVFDAVHAGKIDTWDYQLNLAVWSRNMITILPQLNLVENIGFAPDATRTTGDSKFANLASQEMEFPLRHPSLPQTCSAADDYTAQQMFLRSFLARAMAKSKAVLRNRAQKVKKWMFA